MTVPSVPIELDKLRHIRYNANAIADLEAVINKPFSLIAIEKAGVSMCRAMLWAGIKWEEKEFTLEQAGDLIDGYVATGKTLDQLFDKMIDAFVEGKWFARVKKPTEGGEKNVRPASGT